MAFPTIIRNPATGITSWGGNNNLQAITVAALIGATTFARMKTLATDNLFRPVNVPPGASDIKYRFVNDVEVARGQEGEEASNYQTLQFQEIHLDVSEYQVAAALTRLVQYKSPEPLEVLIMRAFARAMSKEQNRSAISSFSTLPLEYGSTSKSADQPFFNDLVGILGQGVEEVQDSPFVDSVPAANLVLHHSQVKDYLDSLTGVYNVDLTNNRQAAAPYRSSDEALRAYAGDGFLLVGGLRIRIDNGIPISPGATGSATGGVWNQGTMIRPEIAALDQVFRRTDETGTRIVYSTHFGHGPSDPNSALRVITKAKRPTLA